MLGHGIGLRTAHFAEILERGAPKVDFVEIVSENFFEPGGRPFDVLEKVRAELPAVAHGVSLGIGSVDPLSDRYLDRLAALVRRIEPVLVSDHLCWGGHGGRYAHDLLPLPYTEEALAHVVERVSRVQERLGRRILLENVSSYVTFTASSMSEWEFLTEVAQRSGCGILLDVNNVLVTSVNHGFDAATYVDAIPARHVEQVHLAGHTDRGGWLLDSHVGPVPDSVWDLYRRLIARTGPRASLVEWDEDVPALDVVVAEARRAAAIEKEVRRAA